MQTIDAYFNEAVKKNASDVHLVAGQQPMIRIDGQLYPVEDTPLPADALQAAVFSMLTPEQATRYKEVLELDISHASASARFRVNIHQ